MDKSSYGKRLAKNAAKKGASKLTKKILKKIIASIGLPAFIAVIFSIILVASIAANFENDVAGLMQSVETTIDTETGEKGKATYVGVDDRDTELSRVILPVTRRWSNSYSPYNNGYRGWCELWCSHVYRTAGRAYAGSCCADSHGRKYGKKSGKIPKGALIFSGYKRDGTYYENGHRSGTYCNICHHYAGHVAIYIGNGMVAGSQIPYKMSLDQWIDYFGYGGWSTK